MKNYLLLFTLILTSLAYDIKGDVSSNIGVVSQYHFRGIQQTAGASTYAGIDYESGDFSIGTWGADVSDGLEIDIYGSYAFDINDKLSFSIGGTSYQYTGDFDSAYNEINLGASFSDFRL